MKVLLVYEGIHEGGGALKALVESILERKIETEEERASGHPRLIQKGKGGKLFKKAIAWVREAQKRRVDGVVFLTDYDKANVGPDRVSQLTEAQLNQEFAPSIRRAFGVPVKSFDAWMIADEAAMTQVLVTPVNRTPAPETISDPKNAAREIVGERMSLRDFYRDVAACVRLEELKSRCPVGFGPFYERLKSWVNEAPVAR